MLNKAQKAKLDGLVKHYGELPQEQIELFVEQEVVTIAEVMNYLQEQVQAEKTLTSAG